MFKFLGSKTAEQRKSEAAVGERVKRAHAVWDSADLRKRTSLLRSLIDTHDDRVFLADVHAPWSQIPWEDQMKLTRVVMAFDENEWSARKAGEIVAKIFSIETFHNLFGEKPLPANWTSDDALGVWYSLGHFCLLISIGSIKGFQEDEKNHIFELGQASLMNVWKMPKPVLNRFERFNDVKLASVHSTYSSLTNVDMSRAFFSFFVFEILGNDISFAPSEVSTSYLEHLLKGNVADIDPLLIDKVSSAFSYLQESIHDYVCKFWKQV